MFKKITVMVVALAAAAVMAQGLPQQGDDYYIMGQQTLADMLATQPNTNQAKNVIIFIADGAGPTTVTASRIFAGQLQGMSGEEYVFPHERFPNLALVKTYNINAQVSDSAGTATAWSSGVKTDIGVLGVGPDVTRGDCQSALDSEVTTILELAEQAGMATGTVSTARITHATPAANYSHSADRNWEYEVPEEAAALGCVDIASQLIDFPYGDGVDVAMGGGRRNFITNEMTNPENPEKTGKRTDGRDLTQEWVDGREGAVYAWNLEQFNAIDPSTTGPVLGLFNASHLQYEIDRADDAGGEPSLSMMVDKAIDILKVKGGDNGFFLQVESGRVDHASHGGNAIRTLSDYVEFANAIQIALNKVDLEDTLIIVSADHGHTLTFAGYPRRGNPILGLVVGTNGEVALAADNKPYTSLGYINGPGAVVGERPDLSDVDTQAKDFLQQSLVPTSSETHSGMDVAAYAAGPHAYLVRGVVEQNYLFHVMNYALGNLAARAAANSEMQNMMMHDDARHGTIDLSNVEAAVEAYNSQTDSE